MAEGSGTRAGFIGVPESSSQPKKSWSATRTSSLRFPTGASPMPSLAGRDPTTDVAVLRFQPDGLQVATSAQAPLRAGQVVLAVGNS
jgi:hypothetical protein